jgi:hypothetical protein
LYDKGLLVTGEPINCEDECDLEDEDDSEEDEEEVQQYATTSRKSKAKAISLPIKSFKISLGIWLTRRFNSGLSLKPAQQSISLRFPVNASLFNVLFSIN